MIFPKVNNVIKAHDAALVEFGGEPGIQDKDGLSSFLTGYLPMAISYGKMSRVDTAIYLLVRLIQNHFFVDGNKRTAWITCKSFIKVNGCYWIKALTDDEAYDLVIWIDQTSLDHDPFEETKIKLSSQIKCQGQELL